MSVRMHRLPGVSMWSPIFGCSKVTPACDNCVERAWQSGTVRPWMLEHKDEVLDQDGEWNGNVIFMPELLHVPARQRRPTVFNVGVGSDLFHPNVQGEWREKMYGVMQRCPQHHFIVPTRWIDNAVAWLADPGTPSAVFAYGAQLGSAPVLEDWPLSNVTLAVSVEDQARADAAVFKLIMALAARKKVQCSPLMGPIDLSAWIDKIDWVSVAGLWSGRSFLIEEPSWVPPIEMLCRENAVPFFFHGWGTAFKGEITDDLIVAAYGRLIDKSEVTLVGSTLISGEPRQFWPGF